MEEIKDITLKKRGQVDLFYIIAGLFTLGVIIFVVYLMLIQIGESGIFDSYDTANQVYALGKQSISNFDNISLFILVGLSLFVIISAAFVWNHPAYLIIGLFLLAIAITVAGVISNAWVDFADDPGMAASKSAFPKLDFLLQRLPFYILFMGVAALIAMNIGYKYA